MWEYKFTPNARIIPTSKFVVIYLSHFSALVFLEHIKYYCFYIRQLFSTRFKQLYRSLKYRTEAVLYNKQIVRVETRILKHANPASIQDKIAYEKCKK